ncbi:hypothetical protein D3C73_1519670 [compost metagenome]
MSSGIVEGIVQRLTGKGPLGGMKLITADTGMDIHLSVIVQSGLRPQDVCRDLRRNVRETVEKLTGLPIGAIHVEVRGISR